MDKARIEYIESSSPYAESCKDYDNIIEARPIAQNNCPGVRFLIRVHGDEVIVLKHWNVNGQYMTQWMEYEPSEKNIGQIIRSNTPLHIQNTKIQNSILKQSKGLLRESEFEDIIKDISEIISNNESLFFPTEKKSTVTGETKKDAYLRQIALEMKMEYEIVIERETKDLYIYNMDKGIYEKYDSLRFNALLQEKYGINFFQKDAEKIISTFTKQKKSSSAHVAFKNCLLDLETMQPLEFTPDVFCTFQVPFNYDETSYSLFFEEKIREILCDDEDDSKLKLFFQILGYCLTPDNRHNKLFIITGIGGNGKSTLMGLIRAVFGETVVSVPLQEFDKQFGLQPLLGAKVNILYDLPLQKLGDTGRIKAITGEDSLTIDRKFKEPITKKIGTKIVGTGNALPINEDQSEAFMRRIIHIGLTHTFDNPDPSLTKKLVNDVEGMEWLVYRAVQEYKKVETEGWAIQPTTKEARDDYLKYSNPILYAAKELFEPADDDEWLSRKEVYTHMIEFLEGEGLEAGTANHLYYKAIDSIGICTEEHWKNDERVIFGIRLKKRNL